MDGGSSEKSPEKPSHEKSPGAQQLVRSNKSDPTAEKRVDIAQVLSSTGVKYLTDHEKYKILKNHFKPSLDYSFPKKFLHSCNRMCKLEYLSECFVYSEQEDGVFCLYCALFVSDEKRLSLGGFVNKGYSQWHNIQEKKSRHQSNPYHEQAFQHAVGLIERFEQPENTLPVKLDSITAERYRKYPIILNILARVVHLLGKQGLAFRGHREVILSKEGEDHVNPGNFIMILREISNYNSVLADHLQNADKGVNVSYLSPRSQNELIDIIGIHSIQADLIQQIKESGYFSLMADEVTASNQEILTICVRFVDAKKEIREVFLQYLDLERITGVHIGNAILDFFKSKGIETKLCYGQCYDGAPNMLSDRKGVASIILQQAPKAKITHCCSHNLNLSLAKASKIESIDRILDQQKAVQLYFNASPKRERLLEHIVQLRCHESTNRSVLVGLCKTRWSERDISYEHFYLAIPHMIEAFEVINGTHPDIDAFDDDLYRKGWDSNSKKEATGFINTLANFEFIVGIISLYRLLHPLVHITQKLQGRAMDVVSAYNEVHSCISDMQVIRETIDEEFSVIYRQAERMANQLFVTPIIPRVALRQMHRNNVPATTPEEYYRRAMAIPLLDTFISEMKFRFNEFSVRSSKLLLLVPSVLCSTSDDHMTELDSVIEEYKDELPNYEVIDQELRFWKQKYQTASEKARPSTLAEAIKECNEHRYPNLFVLLKIAATLPVTSAECERTFSVMRRLRTWMRSSMSTEQRLSSLAIMNIHRDHFVDYGIVAQKFFELHPRKIDLRNLIFDD